MGPEALGAELGWWPRRGRDRRIQGRSEPMGSTVSGVERGGTDSRRQEAQQLTFPGGSLCRHPPGTLTSITPLLLQQPLGDRCRCHDLP